MSDERLSDYVSHMRDAAQQAASYIEGMSKDEFLADKRTQQAVILNIVIIGEAATRLIRDHGDFCKEHPDVPWSSMKGMRNRITHGYFSINLDIVWETARTSLPNLRDGLALIVNDDGQQSRVIPPPESR